MFSLRHMLLCPDVVCPLVPAALDAADPIAAELAVDAPLWAKRASTRSRDALALRSWPVNGPALPRHNRGKPALYVGLFARQRLHHD